MTIVDASAALNNFGLGGRVRTSHAQAALLLLLGLGTAIEINIGGTLFLSDFVAAALLPWTVTAAFTGHGRRVFRVITAFAALWLIGAIVTDIVVVSAPANYIRGWARILFFWIQFTAVLSLVGKAPAKLAWYCLGLAVAGIVSTYLWPTDYDIAAPWKFGYSPYVTFSLLSLLTLASASSLLSTVLPTAALALVNLALNFRSMFGFLVVTSCIRVLTVLLPARWRTSSLGLPQIVAILIGAALLGWATISLYGTLAGGGGLGVEAQRKYEAQSHLGPILGGRSESLVSVVAIADAPIIGHGSWAEDRYYAVMRVQLLREAGQDVNLDAPIPNLIPAHSYFFGAWVEAGVTGGIFWLVAGSTSILALFRVLPLRGPHTTLLTYLLVSGLWDIIFSPFGAEARFLAAAHLTGVAWVIQATANTGRAR